MPQSHKVGFVSLGCPKALVDSERILTQLKTENYEISADYTESDIVIINTCGFIDPAVEESLQAIEEALEQNGKVIVTGCLGGKEHDLMERYPDLLAVSGAHDYEQVMNAVHEFAPFDPSKTDGLVVPPEGVKLTPKHYAYLKISEGCNHSCSFCIIPSLRGPLETFPIESVLQTAENLVKAGVKELLVIGQDTSAYGLDVKYPTGFYNG
jgi:ribosomal protein S12 methylthiotransferase